MKKSIARLLSQPLLQFLVMGVILYALSVWVWGVDEVGDEAIVITESDVSQLEEQWRARFYRAPTDEELVNLVQNRVREVALYRHAKEMGLDRNDPTIQRVIIQKLRTLVRGLIELNLSPGDQELRAYFETNKERFQPSDLITFTQIFFDPDERGDTTLADAEIALEQLRSLGEPTEGIEQYGDRFMLQNYYPQKDEVEIRKLLGSGFADSVFKLQPGRWQGPVLSGYGVHLVFVHRHGKAAMPDFETVQDDVRQAWLEDKGNELEEEYFKTVMANYQIVYEGVPEKLQENQVKTGSAK